MEQILKNAIVIDVETGTILNPTGLYLAIAPEGEETMEEISSNQEAAATYAQENGLPIYA